MLPFEEALNEADHRHGHRRVYNPETFRRDWTEEMLTAFVAVGERYPDITGEIYVVAQSNRVEQPS
jgi:hypothetical protein